MIQKAFADSLPLSEKRDGGFAYLIAGIPFDGTSSFRSGSRKGPDAVREASYNFESYLPELGVDLADLQLFDAGDMEEAGTVEEMRAILGMELETLHSRYPDIFPIFLGGEHSLTPGVLEFLSERTEKLGERLGIVYLDAHMDMRNEYLGIEFSHSCAARRSADIVGVENIIPIGVRSYSKDEADYLAPLMDKGKFRYYTTRDVREKGGDAVGKEVTDRLLSSGCTKLYLSIDMDAFDPSEAPGVGNPEAGGLSYFEVMDIVTAVAPYLCGMDLVEVNPLYDKGITALLGAKVVREIIGLHYARNK
ncbi:MAG: agmatinase [Thermoplasmata archaeon]|nr:agmatinase [Thermoplasmata archaeon]